jgi:hypothetical protein
VKRNNSFIELLVLLILISAGCSAPPETEPQPAQTADAPTLIQTLALADYPPSSTPYLVEDGDFWLVHTPAGALLSFILVSPEYASHISVDQCRFAWSKSVQRFADPCSGDEWELDGRLNLENSTELWSNRDLDQYAITVEDGLLYVHLSQKKPGPLRVEAPPTA